MTILFADTSALAKRYVIETGSAWLSSQVDPGSGNVVVISALTTVELVSLISRLQLEGNLPVAIRNQVEADFLLHAQTDYLVQQIDDGVLARARRLIGANYLRTLDAIQLASALEAQATLGVSLTFVSADRRLLTVATAEGLLTDDPNRHP